MNIKEFKKGDIITRNEPCIYKHNNVKDSSWCGDRMIFEGHDPISKIFFLKHTESSFKDEITTMSYAREAWDEGWCYYPETLWQKITKVTQNKIKKCPECGKIDCNDPLHWD